MREYLTFDIGGEGVGPAGLRPLDVENPATELHRIALGSSGDSTD